LPFLEGRALSRPLRDDLECAHHDCYHCIQWAFLNWKRRCPAWAKPSGF